LRTVYQVVIHRKSLEIVSYVSPVDVSSEIQVLDCRVWEDLPSTPRCPWELQIEFGKEQGEVISESGGLSR
jgi:hypothetical protein